MGVYVGGVTLCKSMLRFWMWYNNDKFTISNHVYGTFNSHFRAFGKYFQTSWENLIREELCEFKNLHQKQVTNWGGGLVGLDWFVQKVHSLKGVGGT